jgi:hypothetical protein
MTNSSMENELHKIWRTHLVDPNSTGDKEKLMTKRLHYADASPDLQTKVFECLAKLPFRSYIAYDLQTDSEDYISTYLRLARIVIQYAFMFCDSASVEVIAEENPRVRFEELCRMIQDLYKALESQNNRRPVGSPEVTLGKKNTHLSLAVADFILAAFGKYAVLDQEKAAISTQTGKPPGEQAGKRFERVRDKIKLIHSVPTGEKFRRLRPFAPWPKGNPNHSHLAPLD